MNTNLKVILTAMSIAALASPVMAQPESHPHAAASMPVAHGSAAHAHVRHATPSAAVEGSRGAVNDCIHVAFPQCGGDATQTQR
jgi:hypothetical protein